MIVKYNKNFLKELSKLPNNIFANIEILYLKLYPKMIIYKVLVKLKNYQDIKIALK
jgi:hypothetical protein